MIDTFKSLKIIRRYYEANEFELKIPLSINVINDLSIGNALRLNGTFYYINWSNVESLESGVLNVKGVSLFGWLSNRIIWENYIKQAKPEFITREILLRHVINPTVPDRKLNLISVGDYVDLGNETVQFQNSYGMVREQIEKLCNTHDFGFTETPIDPFSPSARIDFYRGNDLSDSVEFTTDAENILTERYEASDFDERNVALVAGEGEGSDRELVTLGNGGGLNRKELYVDARDLQSESEGVVTPLPDYRNILRERGNEKLSEHRPILVLDGDINTHNQLYEYQVDYDLGDVVKRTSPTFNISYNGRITEITEIYEDGLHIIPTFGRKSPTLIDMIKRK